MNVIKKSQSKNIQRNYFILKNKLLRKIVKKTKKSKLSLAIVFKKFFFLYLPTKSHSLNHKFKNFLLLVKWNFFLVQFLQNSDKINTSVSIYVNFPKNFYLFCQTFHRNKKDKFVTKFHKESFEHNN